MKKQQIILLIGICLSAISLYSLYETYKDSCQKTLEEAKNIFQTVIRQDKEIRFSQLNEPVYFFYSGEEELFSRPIIIEDEKETVIIEKDSTYNPTSREERNDTADHLLLLFDNPIKVEALDSLFNQALKQKGYSAETAVIYTTQSDTLYSKPDTSFRASTISLGEIRIIPPNVLVLEAFVKIPFTGKIVKDKNTFLLIISIWILGIGICIWFYHYKRGKKNVTILPLESSPRVFKKITENLFFDEEQGSLSYEETTVELNDLQLKLFSLLLNSPDYFQTYTEIKKCIWNNVDAPLDTVNKTVVRLRKNISSIPVIKIESLRGKGCLLIIEK